MKNIKFISCTLLIISFSACQKEPFWGVKGRGDTVKEVIQIKGFNKIDVGLNADVYYTQDSSYKVEIEAQRNIQRVIETAITKNVLSFKASKKLMQHKPIRITIHSPNINGFHVSGNGDLKGQNPINTAFLDLNISGSGSIQVPALKTDHLNSIISGAGNIIIESGSTSTESINICGSGKIRALELKSQKSVIDVSGSGDVQVWVTEQLTITISGSGMVSYKGSPLLNSQISGSGKIIHI